MPETEELTYTFILEGLANETEGLIVAMTGQTVSSMESWLENQSGRYKIIRQTDFEGGVSYMTTNNLKIAQRRLTLKLRMLREGNMEVFSRL